MLILIIIEQIESWTTSMVRRHHNVIYGVDKLMSDSMVKCEDECDCEDGQCDNSNCNSQSNQIQQQQG